MGGKGTPAVEAARRGGIWHAVHEVVIEASDHDVARRAAEAMGVDPARVHKTLVVAVGTALGVALVPSHREADLKAVAAALGAKRCTMAVPAEAERATGYVVGGISPLGQRRRLALVLDAAAVAFDTIFVSAGRRGLELELSPADLLALTGGAVAPITAPEAT